MSASVSLCLSSKPCQRQLLALYHRSVAPRLPPLRQCELAIHPQPTSRTPLALLIAYVTQQTQGQGVCRVCACGVGSACALLSALDGWFE